MWYYICRGTKEIPYSINSIDSMKGYGTMNDLKLINEVEQNSFFNESTQNNGGGYYQPLLTFNGKYNNYPLGVIISDTSCGDFGTRYSVAVVFNNKTYEYYYSSMNDDEWGNIPHDLSDFIYSTCGYWCDY